MPLPRLFLDVLRYPLTREIVFSINVLLQYLSLSPQDGLFGVQQTTATDQNQVESLRIPTCHEHLERQRMLDSNRPVAVSGHMVLQFKSSSVKRQVLTKSHARPGDVVFGVARYQLCLNLPKAIRAPASW